MCNQNLFRTVRSGLLACLVLFLLSSCASTKSLSSLSLSEQVAHSIDSLCAVQLQQGHYPGLAVSVFFGKNKAWSKGYGFSNLEKKVPVDPTSDLFRIGSISKTITATALARVTEKGLVDMDVPISTYYKECPEDKRNLTLRQIGGHLAGIRHYSGVEFLSNIHYTNVTAPLEVFIHDTLLCQPGTKFNYSTYGWTLISAVMEKAVKKSFLDIINEEVKYPLDLTDLKADQKDSSGFQRVTFYEWQDGKAVPSPVVDNSNKWAGGGFLCSAEDLGRFGYALVQPGFLNEKSIADFTQSQVTTTGEKTDYGIGFRIGMDEKGRSWYGHSGGSVGGTSMLLIYPEQDLAIVTLVNMGSAQMEDLAWKIGEIVLRDKE